MGLKHCHRCPFKAFLQYWDTTSVIIRTCSFCDELQVTAESLFRCPLLITVELHCVSLRPVKKALPSCGLTNLTAPHLLPMGVTFLVVSTEVSIAETPCYHFDSTTSKHCRSSKAYKVLHLQVLLFARRLITWALAAYRRESALSAPLFAEAKHSLSGFVEELSSCIYHCCCNLSILC